jgi:hypothetical protein
MMRPSDEVAAEVQAWRRRQGWSYADLAKELEKAGMSLSVDVLTNILTRRPVEARGKQYPARAITIDEIVAFAKVFDTSAIHFLPRSVAPVVYSFELRLDSEAAFTYFERHYSELAVLMERQANQGVAWGTSGAHPDSNPLESTRTDS